MSPSKDSSQSQDGQNQFENLNLHILGVGVEYPRFTLKPEELETFARRFHPKSPALDKVLLINGYTGIETRSVFGTIDHPLVNKPEPPTIAELGYIFLTQGVKIAVDASRQAIAEWGGDISEITHVVSTTCTNSANPGFDHFVVKELGINTSVEKVLLHGVGCAGGLAALRTAAELALGSSFRRKPARILVVACEMTSYLVRSELESIHRDQDVRIGVTLFSDCASAVVLSNDLGVGTCADPVYELLAWDHRIIDNTEQDLGFDVDPLGWKVVLTPRVPKLASASVAPVFADLVNSVPELVQTNKLLATEMDWALHPGGSTVITGVESAMGLTPEHLRASYDIYINHGNSSSATIFAVMDRLRKMGPGNDHVVGCAFGPGITIEMMIFRRRGGQSGSTTPEELIEAEPVD